MYCALDSGTTYLQGLGAHTVAHSGRTLIDHLLGTHALLSVWKQPEAVCMTGLLHAVYGTASGRPVFRFRPDRQEVRLCFGAEIEGLVFAYSRYKQEQWPDRPFATGAIQDALAIVYLANLVDQAVYLPSQIAPVLKKHLKSVRRSLSPTIVEWMDTFIPMVRAAHSTTPWPPTSVPMHH